MIAGALVAVIAALGSPAATQLLGDDPKPAPNTAATLMPSATEHALTTAVVVAGPRRPRRAPRRRSRCSTAPTTNGLASQTADKLAERLQARGSTGDYTCTQQRAFTVFYKRVPRAQARNIARELNISALRAMDTETQAQAGERADVAVVVGSDKAPRHRPALTRLARVVFALLVVASFGSFFVAQRPDVRPARWRRSRTQALLLANGDHRARRDRITFKVKEPAGDGHDRQPRRRPGAAVC